MFRVWMVLLGAITLIMPHYVIAGDESLAVCLLRLMKGAKFLEANLNLEKNFNVKRIERRLLGNGIKSPKSLSKKIALWTGDIERTHFGKRRDLGQLKKIYHERHLIKEGQIPEAYFQSLVRDARRRGFTLSLTPEIKVEQARRLIEDHPGL